MGATKLKPLEEVCELKISFLTSEVIRRVSKGWSRSDWENYLKHLDYQTPEEELYVGTPKELERYIEKQKRKASTGMPCSSDCNEFGESED